MESEKKDCKAQFQTWVCTALAIIVLADVWRYGVMLSRMPSTARIVAYVLPGLVSGLSVGALCAVIATSLPKLARQKRWVIRGFVLCVAAGVIGGYPFAVGAAVAVAFVEVFCAMG